MPLYLYFIQPYAPPRMANSEISQLQKLYRQLFESQPERAREINYTDIWEALTSGRMWIGHTEGKIVAMGFLIPNLKCIASESFGSVHDIVTDKKHRGKVHEGRSLAACIMDEIIRDATLRRFKYLELTSSPERVAANKLYQKLGFRLIANANQDDQAGTNLYRLYLKQTVTI